jgi:hypothetical protein
MTTEEVTELMKEIERLIHRVMLARAFVWI